MQINIHVTEISGVSVDEADDTYWVSFYDCDCKITVFCGSRAAAQRLAEALEKGAEDGTV